MIINDEQKKAVLEAIEKLFGETQAKLLGDRFNGNKIFFTVAYNTPFEETLAGIYTSAIKTQNPDAFIDTKTIDSLAQITANYVDAQKLKTINNTMMDVLSAPNQNVAFQKIIENMDRAKDYITMLLATETQMVRAFANQNGITQIAASLGDEDPYIYFTGKIDQKLCKYCRAMYHTQNNINVPKVFRLAELKEGYFKPKEWDGFSPFKSGHPNCFDDQTEVLTNGGWKFFKDLSGDELFMSVNPQTHVGEWVKSVSKVQYHFEGNLHHYTSNTVDLMVTPNHSQPIILKKDKSMVLKPSAEIFHSKKRNWALLRHIPKWEPVSEDFLFDGHTDKSLVAELLGYWLSEGYIETLKESNTTFKFVICQKKHPTPMIECVKKYFRKDNVYYKHDKIVVYWPKDSDLYRIISRQGKSFDKFVPTFIKESDVSVIRAFLDAYCLGDGSRRERADKMFDKQFTPSTEISYHTSSYKMVGDICEMILKLSKRPFVSKEEIKTVKHKNGIYTSNHPSYTIRENKGYLAWADSIKKTEVPYEGLVYDVELEKNHTLFVKRNGRIVLSGNCRHSMQYLARNFGFDDRGFVIYKYLGYDALAEQRGLEKTELPFSKTEFGDIEDYFEVGFNHNAHSCEHHH